MVGNNFDTVVVIAANNLVFYGFLACYRDIEHVLKINEKIIMEAGGDFAYFQFFKRSINQKIVQDMYHKDELEVKPKSLYNVLTRLFYNRRSCFNP